MSFKLKNSLFILIPSLLIAGCSGGGKGSFDLEDVSAEPEKITHNKKPGTTKIKESIPTKSTSSEYEVKEGIMAPALGYEARLLNRNIAPGYYNESGGELTAEEKAARDHLKIEPDNIKPINGSLNIVPHLAELQNAKLSEISHSHDNGFDSRKRDFSYVRSGYVFGNSYRDIRRTDGGKMYYAVLGTDGYLYYQGENPSKALPTKTFTYTGVWDFISDVDKEREKTNKAFGGEGTGGTRTSAASFLEDVNHYSANGKLAHSSTFEVDFSNKKLTGELYKNHRVITEPQKITHRYSIHANISGNRFNGKAIAKDSNDTYFGQNSTQLEGGFFGPHAEELAGKFLADDQSLLVTFAAKRDSSTENNLDIIVDAKKNTLTKNGNSIYTTTELDNFGHATAIVIDGKEFSLIPASNSHSKNGIDTVKVGKNSDITAYVNNNTKHMKFGYLQSHDELSQFIQGERTPSSQLPKSGEFVYKGNWNGNFTGEAGSISFSPGDANARNEANFSVNFSSKKIDGNLIAGDSIEPTLIITGNIHNNGFIGTATTSTKGITIDSYTSNVLHAKGSVEGGFYGPKGDELGGVISNDESNNNSKVNAVFGATREPANN